VGVDLFAAIVFGMLCNMEMRRSVREADDVFGSAERCRDVLAGREVFVVCDTERVCEAGWIGGSSILINASLPRRWRIGSLERGNRAEVAKEEGAWEWNFTVKTPDCKKKRRRKKAGSARRGSCTGRGEEGEVEEEVEGRRELDLQPASSFKRHE
jgi:hypothetical protein